MGNCSQKSSAATNQKAPNFFRITTDLGQIMDLPGPKLAREVLDDFPGYGIYQRGQLSLPLFDDELLCNGQTYYLLPFGVTSINSVSTSMTPFSGSLSCRRDQTSSSSAVEVLPSKGNGVWRVKMAISSRDLEEMMSAPGNAEALIEMMRSAAKTSEPSPTRSFGWRSSMAVLSGGFKIPVASRRLTAC